MSTHMHYVTDAALALRHLADDTGFTVETRPRTQGGRRTLFTGSKDCRRGCMPNVVHIRKGSAFVRDFGCGVRDAVRDAPERRLYSIDNPLREWVRPLVYRLVGDADSLGGGGGCAPEKLDGLVFEHGELNHSSDQSATIVFDARAMMATMVAKEEETYKDRLVLAMAEAKVNANQLADHLGVSYTAVKKVMDGKSAAMNAINHAKTAKFLKVGSDWLATGEGKMAREDAWPLPLVNRDKFEQLDAQGRGYVQSALNRAIDDLSQEPDARTAAEERMRQEVIAARAKQAGKSKGAKA